VHDGGVAGEEARGSARPRPWKCSAVRVGRDYLMASSHHRLEIGIALMRSVNGCHPARKFRS
jgi:hypothetical protein